MTALGRVLAATTVVPFTPATYDEVIYRRSGAGEVSVTADTAMTVSAVYACIRVISEDIASVPLQVFERRGESKSVSDNHPLYDLLHDQPNDIQTAMEFREMLTAFAMLRGFGIAEKVAGPRGFVDQLKPLHPDLIRRETTSTGRLRYQYRDPMRNYDERPLLPEDVFIVKGPFGQSILQYARRTIGLALRMYEHADTAFGRAARPTGALTHPKSLTDTARKNLRLALDEFATGGELSGKPLLLEEGMEWQQLGLSMKDAEFLDTFKWSVPEIARFFRVPLHKIQDLTRSTNNNIEQQSVEYVTDAVRPWAERWEGSIRRDLIIAPRRFFAEHNLEGLLRGDIETRYAAYAVARQWGWLSVNDIRAKENLNPIEGGDDYLVPLNMTSSDGTTLAFAQPPSVQALGYLRTLVRDAAARVVRKEQAALARLEKQTGGTGDDWREGVREFYAEHERFVASVLRIPDEAAERYCNLRADAVLDNIIDQESDQSDTIGRLTDVALARAEVLRLPAEAAA